MGDSTVNFGLDVTTGESVSSVDKLTNSVSSLLERYTELMTKMGRGDEVFGKVFKAMGSNAKDFKAAAEEIARAQKMLAGDTGTNKASKNMSSQFKSLATELKTSLAGIPNEIKSATTQMLGMTTILQNQLGSIGVNLVELKERLTQAGTAAEAAKKKIAGSKGTTDKDITERQKQQAAFYDAGIARELEARKAQKQTQVELAARAKAQYKEQQAEEAKKAQMVTSYFAQNTAMLTKQRAEIAKLNAEQEKATNKKNKETDADLQRIITNQYREQQQEEKRLAQVAKTEAAAKIALLKEEEVKRKAVIAAMREQAVADRLGTKDNSAGTLKNMTQGLLRNIEAVQQATVTYGATSKNTIFQTISTFKAYIDEVKKLDDAYKDLAKETKDPSVLKYIEDQRAGLKKLKEEAVLAGKGLSFGGADKLKNTEAIRTQEEIELLKKYAELTDKVRLAKEKLNSTKGSKSDTSQARNEMEALRKEQEALSRERTVTAKMFAAVDMSGSKAMDDIRASSKRLGNEMASFKGTISATESSFKNMWGSMTMALGKFMLIYHTFSIGFGALRGMFNGLVTSLNKIMTVGEKFSNVQKVFRSIEGSNKSAAGEDWARLTAQAERYGMAISDLAEPYQKWIMTMKATNMNIKEGWMLFEHMIASARPLGVTDPQGMSEYFAGLTQMISKGKTNMEDFRQQLAEKIPGLYFSVKEAVAKAMKIDPKVFDFEGMVKKGAIPLNALLVAIDTSLLKFAQLGETVADSYSANVNRMKNAWETFLAQMSAGPVGSKINSIVTDLTKALSNKDFQNALAQVASGLASIAGILVKLATVALPALSAQIRQFVGDKRIAESNPELYAATQRATEAQRPKNVADMLNGKKMWTTQEQQALTSDIVSSDLIASIRKGYIYAEDGTLKKSASATEALTHQLKVSDEELNSNFDTLVLQPLLKTMEKQGKSFADLKKDMFDFAQELSIKAGGIYDEGSLLKAQESFVTDQKINKAGYSTTGIGYNDRLYSITKDTVSEEFARNTQQESMATFKNQEAVFLNSLRASSQALEQASDAALKMSPAYAKFLRDNPLGKQLTYGTQTAITETGLSEVDKGESEAEKTKRENMERAFRAEMERLDGALSAAQAGGSWATKIQKVANQAAVKDITAEKFTPEMQAQLDVKRNAAVAAQQTDLYSQAMQQLEGIDAEIESRIAAGSLKNELKTQYEDIIKWQIKTTNDLEKNYVGLDGVDIQARVSKIQQAVERASEQALTQGNTPMEIIAKAEERAAKGRTDAWQSTHKELVEMEQGFSGVQIEQQFGLMQTLDEIAGTRGEKEKQRINEAAEIDKRNFKNTENMAVAQALKLIAVDEDTYNKRKAIFGDLYDAATTDADNIAIEKLNTQFQGLQDTFGNTIPLLKEYERSLQAITDRQVDKKIANASNFTEYLNTRFSKEQGLFDNQTVATTKQFEKMYDVIGSGASEMGQTLQQGFTDAFTGVLKSWQDVWKQIQATFIKGLAAMIWAAKMRPIQLSIVSALTGVTPAIAGGSTAGQTAAQAHDFVTGGSQASVGIFSKLTKNVEEMTKSINDFGKETLGLASDLTDALAGGLLGVGIASVMFPDSTAAKIGGAMGGALGEVAGEAIGTAMGTAAGGPIGSVIGSVLGSTIGNFLTSTKKVTDYGIRVSVDEEGLKFLDKYERVKKSGSLNLAGIVAMGASMGTMFGTTWQNGSKRDRYSEVDPEVYRQISSAITTSFSTVSRQMLSLGLAPDFSGFSIDEKVSLKGKDPEALLQAWLNKLSGKMVDTALANDSVLASFAAAKKMGETSSDALTRLVEAMTALEAGAIKANISIEALAGGLSGIDLASYASDFSDALGGSSGVSAFFDRIEKFIGYTGTQGITNINTFEDKFTAALGNINSYSGESGTRASVLAGQKMNLELTKASIESNLEKFASGGGWRQWLKFDGENLIMTGKGGYTTPEQMAAAAPKWKATLDPMIAYVEELKTINQALAAIDTKIERESNLPQAANLSASSATFWGDYQKALSQEGGLTPELAAAWDAAAQVAESLAEMRTSAISAREELEKQAATYNEQRQTLELSAQYFRASSTGLKSLSLQAQALNQSDLGQWFKQVGNQIAEDLVPGLMSFNRTGETAFDTLIRLTNIFQSTEQAAALAGTNLATLSGGLTGLGTANYAQGLADYFGGADIVSSIFSNISDAVYTDDESKDVALQYWKKQAESQAKALGTDLENSKAWIKGQLASPLSAEQLQSINVLATSLNNMEDASSSASDAVDDLADYLQDLTDKILTLGMTETEEFIFNLKNEVKDMYDTIIEKGGTENQAQLAYKYQQAAIKQRLDDTMKEINLSIRKLVSNELVEQINQLSDSYLEQINSAMLLGAAQEELNAILYNSYLQAKQVLASAANAYITAYDTSLSKIEELKNKQQALEDDVDTARNDYMTSLKKEIDLKQEAIDKLQENVDSLKDFILNLKDLKTELATSAGFLSPEEKAGVTLSEFSKTANLAAGGDADARSKISDKAKSAIDAATSGSYEQYISTFAAVYGRVSELETSAQTQLTPQEKQLQVLTASRDAMQAIYDELQKAADKTLAVDDARTAYENAQIALSNSTYDAQIAAMQAEADRHKVVVEALRLQYDTTLSLTQASQQYYQVKDAVEAMMPGQEAMAADMELIRKNSEKQKEALQLIEEYLYPETTPSGDTGIKTIVAATSVRDGVLLALRAANDLTTMDATSVVGLLNGIKTCSCASTPTDGCATYGDVGECDAFNDVLLVADPSKQATLMTDKVFNTVEAAMSYVKTRGTTFYLWSLKEEDADCQGVSNVFMTTNS